MYSNKKHTKSQVNKCYHLVHLLTLKLQSLNLSIRLVYRLPQVSILNFCNEFLDMIERDFNVTKDKSIIIGDCNIHMDTQTESDAIIFSDLLDSLNMKIE